MNLAALMIAGGAAVLVVFVIVETRVKEPMINLKLFRIRAFAAGNLAVLLSSLATSGMQFMLIMWLQGIWLPLHGYSFERTPLWAGIYLLPMTAGFFVAGPLSGMLSDRYGARYFSPPTFSIFAQVSRSDTVRLNTSLPGVVSGSTAK